MTYPTDDTWFTHDRWLPQYMTYISDDSGKTWLTQPHTTLHKKHNVRINSQHGRYETNLLLTTLSPLLVSSQIQCNGPCTPRHCPHSDFSSLRSAPTSCWWQRSSVPGRLLSACMWRCLMAPAIVIHSRTAGGTTHLSEHNKFMYLNADA